MRRWLKTFADPKLARKIRILRTVFLLLAVSIAGVILLFAADGEMLARGSSHGGRFVSDGELSTVYWSDAPAVYLLLLIWYIAMSIAFVGGLYFALARLVEKNHGRRSRFFQRKYPH